MNIDRTIEIIDAYGADPARWPEVERAAALAMADEPRVAQALREAAVLDRDLTLWAARRVPLGDPLGAVAVALAANQPRTTPWRWAIERSGTARWAAGGGIAAALLAGLVLVNPDAEPVKKSVVQVTGSVSDEQAFTLLFTPTPDEENAI